ncbi:hypothetical protein AALP_AA3G283600 [Arabis alpina]|uniref:Uncharacterized protein n=1 Tax=Arabis alpina TaxID=50452 RepID=A0A087HCA5_ARAAL|nr:hypothetical protein AALP_AA3G283600 [Arabis alpina]
MSVSTQEFSALVRLIIAGSVLSLESISTTLISLGIYLKSLVC